jgi:cytoskeletal protein RodZ
MYTPPDQLDGTITGIIFTVIVAVLGLAALIALVFWAARQKPPSVTLALTRDGAIG